MRTKTLAFLNTTFGKNFSIPLPELEGKRYCKTPEEVVSRLFLQSAINVLTEQQVDADIVLNALKTQGAYHFHETQDEYFFNTPYEKMSKQDIINMSWYIENTIMFAWCFNIIKIDPIWKKFKLSMAKYAKLPPNIPCDLFIKNNMLRPIEEVLQMADLLYCLHWLLLEGDADVTSKVSLGIVTERRKVLDWLISDDKWYDVSLDT